MSLPVSDPREVLFPRAPLAEAGPSGAHLAFAGVLLAGAYLCGLVLHGLGRLDSPGVPSFVRLTASLGPWFRDRWFWLPVVFTMSFATDPLLILALGGDPGQLRSYAWSSLLALVPVLLVVPAVIQGFGWLCLFRRFRHEWLLIPATLPLAVLLLALPIWTIARKVLCYRKLLPGPLWRPTVVALFWPVLALPFIYR